MVKRREFFKANEGNLLKQANEGNLLKQANETNFFKAGKRRSFFKAGKLSRFSKGGNQMGYFRGSKSCVLKPPKMISHQLCLYVTPNLPIPHTKFKKRITEKLIFVLLMAAREASLKVWREERPAKLFFSGSRQQVI